MPIEIKEYEGAKPKSMNKKKDKKDAQKKSSKEGK
jgi:hypothetical protein